MQRTPYTTLAEANRKPVTAGLPGTRPWMAWLLGLAVACALLGTAWQRFAGEPLSDQAGPVQWQRTLHFADRPNGDIAVLDATSGLQVAQFQGEQGFRDPATGMRLNLESFGPTNAANFSRLQSASPATPAIFETPATQGKS